MFNQMKKISIIALILAVCIVPMSYAQDTTVVVPVVGLGQQGQGQGQGQSIDMGTSIGSDMTRGRGFTIPGDVQYGPVLNYFGQPLPSEGFQPLEQVLMYSCWFTDGALKSMLKGVEDAEAEFKVGNLYVDDAALATEDGKTKWIKVVISVNKYDNPNAAFKGFITARSDDKRTTMTEVMAKAAQEAMMNGCNVIHFTAQGAVRDVFSSGWGIGLSTTQASIHGNNFRDSNVSSGGLGYSSATAGTRDLPWLQGFGLVDPDLVYPALPVEEEKEPTQTINGQSNVQY